MPDTTCRDLIAYCIQETLGDRCDTHDSACITCDAWGQYDALVTAAFGAKEEAQED